MNSKLKIFINMRRTFPNPCYFHFLCLQKNCFNKFVFGNKDICIVQCLLGRVFTKKLDFFRLYFWSYVQLKFKKFSQTLLFKFLSFSKTLLFCSFIIFKRTQGTNIPSNYIYFMKTNN